MINLMRGCHQDSKMQQTILEKVLKNLVLKNLHLDLHLVILIVKSLTKTKLKVNSTYKTNWHRTNTKLLPPIELIQKIEFHQEDV